jgi:hypothetical protein
MQALEYDALIAAYHGRPHLTPHHGQGRQGSTTDPSLREEWGTSGTTANLDVLHQGLREDAWMSEQVA